MSDAPGPSHPSVRSLLIPWTVAIALVAAAAAVPAYRWPWSTTVTLHHVATGLFISDPVPQFETPYLSFADIHFADRFVVPVTDRLLFIDGASSSASAEELQGGAILTISSHDLVASAGRDTIRWNAARAAQVRPVSSLRAVLVYHSVTAFLQNSYENVAPGDATVTFGYDGKHPVVRVLMYWWPALLAVYLAGAVLCFRMTARRTAGRAAVRVRHWVTDHRILVLLLTLSFVLRVTLILRGGQYFDWDELRYAWGAEIFELLSTGNARAAFFALLNSPDHPGYRLVALVPAFLQVVAAWRTGHPVSETRWPSGEWLPASLLALCSVSVIALVYGLATRTGASRREGLVAAGLAAASTSLLMFARHFLPYDAALAVTLTALWIGMHPRDSAGRGFAVGLLSGLGFLIYEGSWTLSATVGALYLLRTGSVRKGTVRAVSFAGGFMTLPVLLVTASVAAGVPLFTNAVQFASEVTNGGFDEGWLLPWQYLWSADGGVALVYLLGVVALVSGLNRSPDGVTRRGLFWLAGAAALYGCLVVGSNVLQRFAVYDRLARQLVPFLCLAAAAGLIRITTRWRMTPHAVAIEAATMILAAIAFTFSARPLFEQRYPREIVWDAITQYGAANIRLATTVADSVDTTVDAFLPANVKNAMGPQRYVLLNAKDIWIGGRPARALATPDGEVVLRAPHPRALHALQFHGYTPEQRRALRSMDFSIRLIDTSPPR